MRVKKGKASLEVKEFTLKNDEKWDVKCEVSRKSGSCRLNYIFTSSDGKKDSSSYCQQQNSTYVKQINGAWVLARDKKGEGVVRIESKYQSGVPSYNLWYAEQD